MSKLLGSLIDSAGAYHSVAAGCIVPAMPTASALLLGILIAETTSPLPSDCFPQEEVWSMAAAELQDKQDLSDTPATNRQLASLSDVQLVEAFFALEGQLDAALTAASHPSFTPEVRCFLVALQCQERVYAYTLGTFYCTMCTAQL